MLEIIKTNVTDTNNALGDWRQWNKESLSREYIDIHSKLKAKEQTLTKQNRISKDCVNTTKGVIHA